MAWRFRKSLKIGPIRLNLSKSGLGASLGVRGLRVGTDAKGRSYTATSIPGTGIYQRQYSSHSPTPGNNAAPITGARQSSGVGLAVGIFILVFMAGGLVVYLLTPKPTPPPVTPPAALSIPVAPLEPPPAKRRRAHRRVAGQKKTEGINGSASQPNPAVQTSPPSDADVPPPAN